MSTTMPPDVPSNVPPYIPGTINPRLFKPTKGSLIHRCRSRECQTTGDGLLRCSGCRVVRYCTYEHQVADWPDHKPICKSFKDPRAVLARVEANVPKDTQDIGSKRMYLHARFPQTNVLQLWGSLDSATEAVEHMVEIIRLEVDDSFKCYELIVPVLLRLDRDQEAYDVLNYSIIRYKTQIYGQTPPHFTPREKNGKRDDGQAADG